MLILFCEKDEKQEDSSSMYIIKGIYTVTDLSLVHSVDTMLLSMEYFIIAATVICNSRHFRLHPHLRLDDGVSVFAIIFRSDPALHVTRFTRKNE